MKELFCARCQEITPHKGAVDGNGEFVFYCQNQIGTETVKKQGKDVKVKVFCDRFIKFPGDIEVKEFDDKAKKHEEQNVGQVSIEGQEKKLAEILG